MDLTVPDPGASQAPSVTDIADPQFRNDLARALVNDYCRGVAEQLETVSDGSDCGGQTFDPPCGGCSRCQYAQMTFECHTPDGWRRFQEQADQVIESVRAQMTFRVLGAARGDEDQ